MQVFFADNVKKWRLPQVVEILPDLIHLSVFLFFTGLTIFLFNVYHSVFLSVVWWIALVSTLYGCIMLMPLFLPNSPYYTPLSPPIFHIAWSFVHVPVSVLELGFFLSLYLTSSSFYSSYPSCYPTRSPTMSRIAASPSAWMP